MSEDIRTYPLAGWTVAHGPEQTVIFSPEYLTSPFDKMEDAQSLPLVMTLVQARALVEVLERAIDAAELRTDRHGREH